MKEVFAPHLNRVVKLGRKRSSPVGLKLYLRKFTRPSVLPAAPESCDYRGKASKVLADDFMNDEIGDCVIAAGYHAVGVVTGNAGNLFHASAKQILTDYTAIGGYMPGQPGTDNGCDEQTALNYWTKRGFANGTKLLGWLSVDATNREEVMTAMYLFENLMFGVELPDKWISPFPEKSGFVWGDVGNPDPSNGHAFVGTGYTRDGVIVNTWGLDGLVTWDAVAKYAVSRSFGELYVMLTPDQLAKGQHKAPNGFAWNDLIRAFNAMGGNVPVPPEPVIQQPAAVTLAQAQSWAIQGLAGAPRRLMKEEAAALVKTSLAKNWPAR